jgi:putative transposase
VTRALKAGILLAHLPQLAHFGYTQAAELLLPQVERRFGDAHLSADVRERRRFRTLSVIGEGNREGLAIEAGVSIPASRVVPVLDQLIALYGRRAAIRLDDGPELTSQALMDWATARLHHPDLHPGQEARAERLHRTLQPHYREEVLNGYLFHSTAEAQALSDVWLVAYNEHRPYDALGRVPPVTCLPCVSPVPESRNPWLA